MLLLLLMMMIALFVCLFFIFLFGMGGGLFINRCSPAVWQPAVNYVGLEALAVGSGACRSVSAISLTAVMWLWPARGAARRQSASQSPPSSLPLAECVVHVLSSVPAMLLKESIFLSSVPRLFFFVFFIFVVVFFCVSFCI